MAGKQRKNSNGLYEIRESEIQGRGVFAARRIRPGQRIIEYEGERISNKDADGRYDDDNMDRHHTFLFTLDKKTVVDGNRLGNDSRFINHSCDPNCEAVIEDGEIWIYAVRNIQPGVELAYDYQYERTSDPGHEKLYACKCGSPMCRGSIMKPPRKPRKRRRSKPLNSVAGP